MVELNMIKKRIDFFYGRECPSCLAVIPIVKRLIVEEGVEIVKREAWHDAENHQRMEDMRDLYKEHCGGNFVVPSFYDAERKRLICDPVSYEELKDWVFEA